MKKISSLLILLMAFGSSANVCGQQLHPALALSHLTGNLYVYTTYSLSGGELFPANGLYLVTKKGVVVIDSPWDTTQFQPLVDTIWQRHHQPVVLCIATHFHSDRTAALEFFRRKGVKTYTSQLTDEYCIRTGAKRAEFHFQNDTTFHVDGYAIQTYFGGEGHTKDNIVVWFNRDKVLYGGCLVKSTDAKDLGFTSDGNVKAWPETIRRVREHYPDAAYVIPGHQSWASAKSLQHTLDLLAGGSQAK